MNLEAINKWLDEEYGCSYTKLEELHDFYFEKYCDLKQENKKQKEVIDKTTNAIDLVIELIKQQPTEDDSWILDRLNGFKIILEDKEV